MNSSWQTPCERKYEHRAKLNGVRPGRRVGSDAVSTPVILDLCFGEEKLDAYADVPDVRVVAASVGLGAKSARRARGLVADCLLSTQQDFTKNN